MSERATDLFDRAVAGDRGALARAISTIENGADGAADGCAALRPRRAAEPGSPHVVGITGPPGAGKSTLASRLVARARATEKTCAVVAVDPTSPFSGGAILGDRVRMGEHALDGGVFVRSLASRGHSGGLARAVAQVVDLLDAAGFDLVLVETVGVGQTELAVMDVADTVVVVLTPEGGDGVQAMKAGLLEIGHVFAINKSDRPGGDLVRKEIELAVELGVGSSPSAWRAPAILCSAEGGEGVAELDAARTSHLDWCRGEGRAGWLRRRGEGRVRAYLDLVADGAREEARRALDALDRPRREALERGDETPWRAFAARSRG